MQSHEWDFSGPLPVADRGAEPLQQHREDEARGEQELVARADEQRGGDEPPQKSPFVAEEDEADDRDRAAGDEDAARDRGPDALERGLARALRGERVEDAVAERHVKRNQRVLIRVEAPAEGEDALAEGGDKNRGDDLAGIRPAAFHEVEEERRGDGAEGELGEETGGVGEEKEGQVEHHRRQKPQVTSLQVRAIVLHSHRLSIGVVVFRPPA